MRKLTVAVLLAMLAGVSGCASNGGEAQGGLAGLARTGSGFDGAGPDRNLRNGDPLPNRYRTRQYVIEDYRTHKLAPPPKGYHWVQAGKDYFLVSGETGLIEQTVIGR